MATTLIYTVSAYVPFTKILSANINQDKTDIQNRINWAGGTSATTGLGDDNLQSITASGGGLTRATKLKAGTADHVIINSGTGAMSSEAQLALTRGGTGSNLTLTSPGQVLQINAGNTAVAFGESPVPPSLRIISSERFI